MSSPGTDIAFNESRTEGYRAFANKIWNAARLVFMNVERLEQVGIWRVADFSGRKVPPQLTQSEIAPAKLEDRWILSRFNAVAAEVNSSLSGFPAGYRFDNGASAVYDFFWREFCDWYIEFAKPRLSSSDPDEARVVCCNLVHLLEAALRLLHPFMPFITEELWQALYAYNPPYKSISLAPYLSPVHPKGGIDAETAMHTEMSILQDVIASERNLRAELKIEPKIKPAAEICVYDPDVRSLIEENVAVIQVLGNTSSTTFTNQSFSNLPGTRQTSRFDLRLVYDRKIDINAECERLRKELERIEKGISSGQRQLGNEQFLAKAPANVVENLRKQQQELAVLQEKTRSKLAELGCR
jgi:valyl-tRNA synthetase